MNPLKQLAERVRLVVQGHGTSPVPPGEAQVFDWEAPDAGVDAQHPPRPRPQGLGAGSRGEAGATPAAEERAGRDPRSRPQAGGSEASRPGRSRPPADSTEAAGRAVRWKIPTTVADLATVYREGGIEPPLHGYGVDKMHEMLGSPHLASATREVRATAALVALEAAGVPLRDVIDDAVLRSKALAAFEADKALELQTLKTRAERRAQVLREQVEAFLREKNGEIEGLRRGVEAAAQSLVQLQARKRREEERLHRVVTHFVEPRPAVTAPPPAPEAARPATAVPAVAGATAADAKAAANARGASAPTQPASSRDAGPSSAPSPAVSAPSSPTGGPGGAHPEQAAPPGSSKPGAV